MRIAEARWEGFDDRNQKLDKCTTFYDEALRIVPNAVRVLQNLAKMRMLQVADGSFDNQSHLLDEAEAFCKRSLAN